MANILSISPTVNLTLGSGVRSPQGSRVRTARDAASLQGLLTGQQLNEAWWSGHCWANDYRLKDRWEKLGVVAIDIDGTWRESAPKPGKKRLDRAVAPAAAGEALLERLLGEWEARWSLAHLTPRGARIIWLLDRDLDDRKSADGAIRLCSALAAGVIHGIKIDGGEYEVDTKANADLARLYYTPFAVVDGVGRDPLGGVWLGAGPAGGFELGALDDLVGALGLRDSRRGGRPSAATREAVGGALAGIDLEAEGDWAQALMDAPCEGPGDGSLELIQVARKALGLGVGDGAVFARVAGLWNARRAVPWTVGELEARYGDARARWDAEGLVVGVAPGRWTRPGLEKVLREDRKYGLGKIQQDVLLGEILWDGEVLSEARVTEIETDICQRYLWPSIPRDALFLGLGLEASRCVRDPVVEYLRGLEWDGVVRLDSGLADRFKVVVPDRELAGQYLRKTLIACVARAMRPGCKHDHVPVLIGPDRAGKSTALRKLAGDGWFADSHIDPSNKDAYLSLRGVWIYELSELDGLTTRTDVARVKAFVSSQVDKYRPPYGRVDVSVPRRSVFFATANREDVLQDPTSSRRWWVMEVERGIDTEWIGEVRDQLWAEALASYEAGETWWLTTEQEEQREEINAGYTYEGLSSDEQVDRALDRLAKQGIDLVEIAMSDVLKNAYPDRAEFKPFERQKVANSLVSFGYKRFVKYDGEGKERRKTMMWRQTKG